MNLGFLCKGCGELWDCEDMEEAHILLCGVCAAPLIKIVSGCVLPPPVHMVVDDAIA